MSDQLQKLAGSAQNLLDRVHVATDCMSNLIKREHIDNELDVLDEAIKQARIVGVMEYHVQELRPEVLAFAILMEQRLRQKDADKGQLWKDAEIGNLQVCVTAKNMSLDTALTYGTNNEAARHAVDIANFCMMIADVVGALE